MRKLAIAVLGFLAVVSLGLGMVRPSRQATKSAISQSKLQEGKATKLELPTLIQEGMMTEKQRQHSKLFKGYRLFTKEKKLHDLVELQGDMTLVIPVGDMGYPSSFSLDQYLQDLSCKADAIIIGVVKNKASNILEEGTFIFTDYEVAIEEILKNNPDAPIQQNSDITVSRPGGSVKLNNHIIRTIDQRLKTLEAGERYLLFLKFVLDTKDYIALYNGRNESSFQITDNKVTQVSPLPLPFGPQVTTDAKPFVLRVRAAIEGSCGN